MRKKKRGEGVVRRSELYRVLDQLAAEIRKKDEKGRHNAAADGDVHRAYMAWRKDNPQVAADEFHRSYADVQAWDRSSRPDTEKGIGQGVFAFYVPKANLPLDNKGSRKPFEEMMAQDLDDWMEVQEDDYKAQTEAIQIKRELTRIVRKELKHPKDTVGRVMLEVFGLAEPVDSNEDIFDDTLFDDDDDPFADL